MRGQAAHSPADGSPPHFTDTLSSRAIATHNTQSHSESAGLSLPRAVVCKPQAGHFRNRNVSQSPGDQKSKIHARTASPSEGSDRKSVPGPSPSSCGLAGHLWGSQTGDPCLHIHTGQCSLCVCICPHRPPLCGVTPVTAGQGPPYPRMSSPSLTAPRMALFQIRSQPEVLGARISLCGLFSPLEVAIQGFG